MRWLEYSTGLKHPLTSAISYGGVPCRVALLIRRSHHHPHALLRTLRTIQTRAFSARLRCSSNKFTFESNPEVSFLERIGLRRKQYQQQHPQTKAASVTMAPLYGDDTPDEVKNAKGIHLLTMSTPNGQAVQIYLEELKDAYGLEYVRGWAEFIFLLLRHALIIRLPLQVDYDTH